ncbi:hypothetical protein BV22DRAFT_530801 [Leucogyrophana mollusca]|uniref:Uncharacterized protein n=1 Tax=Leucogyrophana mollusca TaxID=85980 RepID=A0ACB8BEG2_9AGAM|nr:hypothetical protein BV22DRAFT_530801 [Leucogyrophana mollusca]
MASSTLLSHAVSHSCLYFPCFSSQATTVTHSACTSLRYLGRRISQADAKLVTSLPHSVQAIALALLVIRMQLQLWEADQVRIPSVSLVTVEFARAEEDSHLQVDCSG